MSMQLTYSFIFSIIHDDALSYVIMVLSFKEGVNLLSSKSSRILATINKTGQLF